MLNGRVGKGFGERGGGGGGSGVVGTEGALIVQEVGEDSIVFAVIDRGRLARWRAPL